MKKNKNQEVKSFVLDLLSEKNIECAELHFLLLDKYGFEKYKTKYFLELFLEAGIIKEDDGWYHLSETHKIPEKK